MPKKRIMFLCTGNSCRSQMAEGYMKALAPEWEGWSAGTRPAGVNPRAVSVMLEDGVDISTHTSDPLDPDLLSRMDVVITLCGDAEETCPLTPPGVRRIHWPLPDPAKATGTEEQIELEFRKVRDEIKRRILEFIGENHRTDV
ncbi:MAG: arsenate reductase (thioredoxin) [Bacillota bacterium]